MVEFDNQNKNLQNLGFRQFFPSSPLQKYIQCFWTIDRKKPPTSPILNRLFPDGGVGVIFNFGSPFYRSSQPGSSFCQNSMTLTGTTKKSVDLCFDGIVNALGIRFHPAGASPFIRTPIHEVTDHVVSLNDLDLEIPESYFGKIADNNQPDLQVELLQNLLISHLLDFSPTEPRLMQSIALIKSCKGLVKIEDVARRFGMSLRHYERQFKNYVGLTPKMFCKIIRIQTARQLIKRKICQTLTEVGYETGFYDQAHFTREFKSIMQMSPREYWLEKKEMSDLYNT